MACGSATPSTSSSTTTTTAPASAESATIAFVGGDVITMDPDAPRATAIALAGDRILAVGTDAEIRALISSTTRVIELGGRTITPGLVDAHCHLAGLGTAHENLQVRGAASAEAVAAAVVAAAKGRDPAEWIVGRGWDQNLWSPQVFPTAAVFDAVIADRPVAIRRVDGHALWVNTKAMELAGITKDTPEPPGGRILRDAKGNPTGVFVDNAMDLVSSKSPPPTAAVIERRILAGAAIAIGLGLTGVHEMGIDDATIAVYRSLAERGALPLRVYGFLQGDPEIAAALATRAPPETAAPATAMFTLRGMKIYADGALGSRGAALLAPYSDAPGETGNWVHTPEELHAAVRAAVDSGWQLGIHAIGDAGIRTVLDAYEAALKARPGEDLRLRIEHAQVVAPEDLPRFAELGVIASMQPTHATSDMPWAEARVGPVRIKGAYAWRSILASGARLAAGSDFPVEEVSPLLGLHAAVSRQDAAGSPTGGWYSGQRLSLEEAIAGFTTGAAYASFAEADRGMLKGGYLADLTVWDRTLAPKSLLQTQAALTIVGGRVVFESQ